MQPGISSFLRKADLYEIEQRDKQIKSYSDLDLRTEWDIDRVRSVQHKYLSNVAVYEGKLSKDFSLCFTCKLTFQGTNF